MHYRVGVIRFFRDLETFVLGDLASMLHMIDTFTILESLRYLCVRRQRLPKRLLFQYGSLETETYVLGDFSVYVIRNSYFHDFLGS